jgi:hypothetical protein
MKVIAQERAKSCELETEIALPICEDWQLNSMHPESGKIPFAN